MTSTHWFMLVTFVVIVIVDVILAVHPTAKTISRIAKEAAENHRWIPWGMCFAMGVLAGHFWWPQG